MEYKPTYEELEIQLIELTKQAHTLQLNLALQTKENKKYITELTKSNERSNESEKQFQLLYNNELLNYQSLDTNTCIIDVNSVWLKTLGYTREEVLGRPFRDFMTPASAEFTKERFSDFIKNGEIHNFEIEILHKNGTLLTVSYEGKIAYDAFGNFHHTHCVFTDITKRKVLESKLMMSNQFNQQIINSAHQGIVVYDTDMKYLVWNPFMEEFTGIPAADILGKHPLEIFPFLEKRGVISLIEKALKGAIINSIEFPFNLITGKKGWSSDATAPLYNNKGEIIGVISTVRDITEQKKLLNDLEEIKNKALEGQESYKALFETIGDAIYIQDYEARFLDVNSGVLNMYGYSKEEFIGNTPVFLSAADKNDIPAVFECFEKVKQGIPQVFEFWGKRKNGEIFPKTVGQYKGMYFGQDVVITVARDITSSKLAEDALKESENNYRKLVETMPDGVYKTTHKGEFVAVNPAMIKMLGYNSKEELLAIDIKNDLYIKDSDRNTLNLNEFSQELAIFQLRKKDGSVIWVEDHGWYSFDVSGEITYHEGIIRDVTERIQKEQELKKAKEKAEESDKLKSAFLANMSHEIRTPMNGILGFADLLKTPNLSGEKQQEYIKVIEKSGERMLNIINDIVCISKIESGLMKVSLEETNFNEQVAFVYTFFKPEVENKGIQFSLKNDMSFNEPIIYTDREKVYAIITNLVKNAIKYTEKGAIELGYYIKDNFLQFYVKDTGIGIPKSQQEYIFERFIQAEVSSKMAKQGAGLGLSITKAYVEMLGGQLWLESEEENRLTGSLGGSTFYFTLPYKKAVNVEESIATIVSTSFEESSTKKLKILIAEDDEASEILLTIAIEEFAREIIIVKNGLEAVEACRKNPDIDLVFMDIQMPEMNGFEATKQIRKFNTHVTIIAQTAYALEGDKEKVMAVGCNDYITKPIKVDALKQLISLNLTC